MAPECDAAPVAASKQAGQTGGRKSQQQQQQQQQQDKQKQQQKKQKHKTKVRFDGLDVAAMVSYWKRVALGRRVVNIYNGSNGDTYIFKLEKQRGNAVGDASAPVASTSKQLQLASGGNMIEGSNAANNAGNDAQTEKDDDANQHLLLLVESGVRFHATTRQSFAGTMPTPFCAKLRKHLRGLRLEQVQQLGNYDRVVNLIFGSGDAQRHSLILEFYARGNIILTNSKYEILSLLRGHEYSGSTSNTKGADGGTANQSDQGDTAAQKKKNGTEDAATNKKSASNGDQSATDGQRVQVRVGHVYPITYATTTAVNSNSSSSSSSTTTTNINEGDLDEAVTSKDETNSDSTLLAAKEPQQWYQRIIEDEQKWHDAANSSANGNKGKKKGKGKNKNGNDNLKWYLMKPTSGVTHYGPSLLDHCIAIFQNKHRDSIDNAEENSNVKGTQNSIHPSQMSSSDWKQLQTTLQEEGDRVLGKLQQQDSKGYIIYQPREPAAGNDKDGRKDSNKKDGEEDVKLAPSEFDDKYLVEFQPHLLHQHQTGATGNGLQYIEYPRFNDAVDAFFSHIQNQLNLQRAQTQQAQAQQRLEKIQNDQQQRIRNLLRQQDQLKYQAMAVEQNSEMVDHALQVINSALNSGMDWTQLQEYVTLEQEQNQNPIALLIHKLQLEQDCMVLRLPVQHNGAEGSSDSDKNDGHDGGDSEKTLDVTVSLKESAFGNSSSLFAKYRASKDKFQKTMEASEKALQAAEETARRQLAEAQKRTQSLSSNVALIRKPMWFEKFHWFITSDNYLVIAGKDAQQNEQLVKRYLRTGDAYLHADVHGAASCILRAKRYRDTSTGRTKPLPLSDQALREAGNFTICKSSAWKSRMVTSAWWVESHQVSKTAPTGEYLVVGSFMIRGKKNFLPPSTLEMGLAVLFRLGDDESIARHKNERRDFALLAKEQEEEEALFLQDNHDKPKQQSGKQRARNPAAAAATAANDNVDDGDDDDDMSVHDISELRPTQNASANTSSSNEQTKTDMTEPQPNSTADAGSTWTQDGQNDRIAATTNNMPTAGATDEDKATAVFTADEKASGESKTATKPKKGLSVKERKLIKKHGSLEAAAKAEEERTRAEEARKLRQQANSKSGKKQQISDVDSVSTNRSASTANTSNSKRGKKAKMKKMMRKYADQDDEERELAMMALHGGEKQKRKDRNKLKAPIASASEVKAANDTLALLRKDPSKVADRLPDSVRQILAECVSVPGNNGGSGKDATNSADAPKAVEAVTNIRWDKFDADVLEQLMTFQLEEQQVAAAKRLLNLKRTTRIDNFSGSLSGIIRTIRKYGHKNLDTGEETKNGNANNSVEMKRKTKAEKVAEDEEWKKTLAEEGIVEADDDDEDGGLGDTLELNRLTSQPDAKDLVLHAVPVCAPYHTLSKYAYRVKLTPGNMKRGKAAKQCVEMFMKDNSKAPSATRNLAMIKQLNDNDWVQTLGLGDVKISAAGASKLAKNQKSKGKQKGGKSKKR